VKLQLDEPEGDRYVRLAADPDLYNRWEAGQSLARQLLSARAAGRPDAAGEARYAEALGRALDDQAAEPAFKSLLLELPSEAELAQALQPVDPAAIHAAREAVRRGLAGALTDRLERLHDGLADSGPFSPDAEAAGRRSLRNAALELLAAVPSDTTAARALRHFDSASNMTEAMGGLYALTLIGGEPMEGALQRFYARWSAEPLVIDKWFAIQARIPGPEVLGRVAGLTAHPAFEPKNPNRLRALVSTFAMANPVAFHDPSGAGYRFVADQILAVDGFNPMTAARMVEAFGHWRRYRPDLGALMKAELARIAAHPGVSKNVFELAQKALAEN
jgi:aminopeptidase N